MSRSDRKEGLRRAVSLGILVAAVGAWGPASAQAPTGGPGDAGADATGAAGADATGVADASTPGTAGADATGAGTPGTAGADATGSAPASGGSGASGSAESSRYVLGDELTLEQCFAGSLVGSRDLMLARTRLEEAEALLLQGWGAVKPTVQFNGTLTRNDEELSRDFGGQTIVIRPLWDYSGSATVSQPIFNGQAIPALAALKAQRAAASLDNARTRTNILYSVATVFYSTLAFQDAVEVTRRQVEVTQRYLELAQVRLEVGEVSKVDVLRARIDLSTAEQELETSRARLAALQLALAVLVGRPLEAGSFALIRPEAPEVPGQGDAVARALVSRPDLAAADERLRAASSLVTAAWLAYAPRLDLALTARGSKPVGLTPDSTSYAGFLTLSWTPYAGGRQRADVQRARIQERQAKIVRDGLADGIREEVLRAEIDLRTAAANLEKARGAAELGAENARLVEARYEAGLATSLDVTDANTRLFQTEFQVLQQRLDLEVAVLALARAMGVFDEVARVPSPRGTLVPAVAP